MDYIYGAVLCFFLDLLSWTAPSFKSKVAFGDMRVVGELTSYCPLGKFEIITDMYDFQGETEDNHDLTRGIVWDEVFAPNIDEVDDDGSTSKLGGALIVAFSAAFFAIISLGAWLFCKRDDFLSGKPWKMGFLIHCI